VPYLKTGKEIFEVCCAYEDNLGVTDFGVMDENFLKFPQRAMELLECIEKAGRIFTFGIFSSAETITGLPSLDLLVRLGVTFVWMGVESKHEIFEKNKGVDFKHLVAELRKRGISVMTSAILFLEEHTKESLGADVDFVTGLRADYVQFMELGPLPGTKLYSDYEAQGKLCAKEEMPYEERHGQNRIWFRHPAFTGEETSEYLRKAFQYEYHRNGASFFRAVQTAMMGYQYTVRSGDTRIRRRAEGFKRFLEEVRVFMVPAKVFAKNQATRGLLEALSRDYGNVFPKQAVKHIALSGLAVVFAMKEVVRIRLLGDVIQPPRKRFAYRFDAAIKGEKNAC